MRIIRLVGEAAADAQETDAVARLEKVSFFGESGGQGQRYGANVAEILEGGEILLGRDTEGFQNRVPVAGAYLVADDLVDLVSDPPDPAKERRPGAQSQGDAVFHDGDGVGRHELRDLAD